MILSGGPTNCFFSICVTLIFMQLSDLCKRQTADFKSALVCTFNIDKINITCMKDYV